MGWRTEQWICIRIHAHPQPLGGQAVKFSYGIRLLGIISGHGEGNMKKWSCHWGSKSKACYPNIPSVVTMFQMVKRSLKFPALQHSNFSSSPLLPPAISLERGDYWHTSIQNWHLLKIKRRSQAAYLMRVEGGWRGDHVPFQQADR